MVSPHRSHAPSLCADVVTRLAWARSRPHGGVRCAHRHPTRHGRDALRLATRKAGTGPADVEADGTRQRVGWTRRVVVSAANPTSIVRWCHRIARTRRACAPRLASGPFTPTWWGSLRSPPPYKAWPRCSVACNSQGAPGPALEKHGSDCAFRARLRLPRPSRTFELGFDGFAEPMRSSSPLSRRDAARRNRLRRRCPANWMLCWGMPGRSRRGRRAMWDPRCGIRGSAVRWLRSIRDIRDGGWGKCIPFAPSS